MRAFTFPGTDAAFNLALEEVLFEALSPDMPALFLIWRNSPSVIVGRHQNTAEQVDPAFCRERGIRIVRRSGSPSKKGAKSKKERHTLHLWVCLFATVGIIEKSVGIVRGE